MNINTNDNLSRGIAHLASVRVARKCHYDTVAGGASDSELDRDGYADDMIIATLAASFGVSARIIRAAVEDMEDALMGL